MLHDLAAVLGTETGRSASGHPCLCRPAWERLRDWIPHLFRDGLAVLEALADDDSDAAKVVRQVVLTAAITSPSDLWVLRQVLSALRASGWLDRLRSGLPAEEVPPALVPDLTLLLGRGYLVRTASGGYRASPDPTARRVFAELPLLPPLPADLGRRWAALLGGDPADRQLLLNLAATPIPEAPHPPPSWVASPEDLELGFRLAPLVLGLRASGATLESLPVEALGLLARAGWVHDGLPTALGRRGLAKAAGPIGIVEAYWPYLGELPRIWSGGTAHVARASNVAASQDANRATFQRANDALDRYCADTGFRYTVFVEHAVGQGEAIRQRWSRPGGDALVYVGADLEPEALAAARREVAAGRLPPDVHFVEADIGRPERLVSALSALGVSPRGAVLLVGNGFHEVRAADDEAMVEVFRGYARAGFLLVFTEESALSVDDLLHTAWNTYHAGFRYVHERSGQQLRPATRVPVPGLGPPLRSSWAECAARAGYRRLESYSWRSRPIHPHPTASGDHPSVSANHFCVVAQPSDRAPT